MAKFVFWITYIIYLNRCIMIFIFLIIQSNSKRMVWLFFNNNLFIGIDVSGNDLGNIFIPVDDGDLFFVDGIFRYRVVYFYTIAIFSNWLWKTIILDVIA